MKLSKGINLIECNTETDYYHAVKTIGLSNGNPDIYVAPYNWFDEVVPSCLNAKFCFVAVNSLIELGQTILLRSIYIEEATDVQKEELREIMTIHAGELYRVKNGTPVLVTNRI